MNMIIHSDGTAELYHHGVKGQKWGVRRYQNPDGSLKKGAKNRYGEWPPKGSKVDVRKKVTTGKKFADIHIDKKQVISTLKTTAAVASGALWFVSALSTGNLAAGANTLAAITNIASMMPHGNDSTTTE